MKMIDQIYIKAWYGGWHPVSVEKAKDFCMFMLDRMICPDEKKKRLIEKNHLKGITLGELLEER